MTVKEMNAVIQDECDKLGDSCRECRIEAICRYVGGDFESNPTECEKAYKLIAGENNVNHPSHYNQGGMECIDEMVLLFGRDVTMHFCLCNAWKYRYRANAKNGQEDLDKANWYIAKYKELLRGAK